MMTKRFAAILVGLSMATSLSLGSLSWGGYGVGQTCSLDVFSGMRFIIEDLNKLVPVETNELKEPKSSRVAMDGTRTSTGFDQFYRSFLVLQWLVPGLIFCALCFPSSILILSHWQFDRSRAFRYSIVGTVCSSTLLCFLQAVFQFGPWYDIEGCKTVYPQLLEAGRTATIVHAVGSTLVMGFLTHTSTVNAATRLCMFVFLYASTIAVTFSIANLLKFQVQDFFHLVL
jgi:hypothetical protein